MQTFTLQASTTLETEECCNCGIVFAMPKDFRATKLRDKSRFFCPAGHGQHYMGETHEQEKARLEQQLRDERNRVAYWQAEEARERRKAAAARGQVTKIKNRVAAGVCPCCTRSFQNLARHMKNQHPDWTPEATVEAAE